MIKEESELGFVGSISPRPDLHKIMLTEVGHLVLVYPEPDGRYIGHVHSHQEGELIMWIKISPEEIGE